MSVDRKVRERDECGAEEGYPRHAVPQGELTEFCESHSVNVEFCRNPRFSKSRAGGTRSFSHPTHESKGDSRMGHPEFVWVDAERLRALAEGFGYGAIAGGEFLLGL